MKLQEWQSDPVRVGQTRKLFAMPIFKELIESLREENPIFYPLPSPTMASKPITTDDRVEHLGKIQGAEWILQRIALYAISPEKRRPIQMDYGVGLDATAPITKRGGK